jgi:hypothetical protein
VKFRTGLHEMTEDNIKLDRQGHKHCRACIRERKSAQHAGSLGVGRHNETATNNYEREMAKVLEANPPVIVWQLDPVKKVQVPVYISDPHAERESKPRKPKGLRPIDIEYLEDIS